MARSPSLAPPAAPLPQRSGALDRLRAAAAPLAPLPALSPTAYAAGHAAFEARSDQRALLGRWLTALLDAQPPGPLSVLSVGCGDGTLDAPVAAALAAAGRDVVWDGVEPHAPVADAFARRMRDAGVASSVAAVPLERWQPTRQYDAVVSVHALYYVPALEAALAALTAAVAPAGRLVLLLAPQGDLNELGAALAPPLDGHRQWWSEQLADALVAQGLDAAVTRLPGRLDLSDCLDPDHRDGRAVLDFAVQAVLPDDLRAPVLDHLREVRRAGGRLVVDHPVDAWVVPAQR